MSLALTSLTALASPLIGMFTAGSKGMIGPLIPGIVLEEDHEDVLTITDHPIERGANVTDHAFKMPARVTIQCQWSNTQAGLLDFSEGYIAGIYTQLLNLQYSRLPITILTSKRLYNNMLIESITTQTDKDSAYALPVTIAARQVILVSTSTTSLPPQDQHIDPQQTAPTITTGLQSLQGTGAGSQSALFSGAKTAGLPVAGHVQ